MPVLGAVVTLSEDPAARRDLLGLLATEVAFQAGEETRGRLPVVLTTDTRDQDRTLWRTLEDHPAVAHLEVAFADFSDLVNEDPEGDPR